MNGVIYARYSSSAQREESIEQQVEACRRFADRNGIVIIEVYADEAISGRSDNRPNFQRLIRDAEKRKFEAVIAYKSNRIARNMLNALQYEDRLAKLGIQTFYAQEEFGNTAAGRFALRNMMNLNQFYSENMAEDIKRGLMDNAQKAIVNTACPYGYRRGADGHYEIVPEEAEIVRSIFRDYADGVQLAEIARKLNMQGCRTRRGLEWNKGSFHRMLSNELYIGVYHYGDVRIEGGAPAIVDEVLFRDCGLVTEGPRRGKRAGGGNQNYLLSGILFCGECGGRMTGITSTGRHGDKHHYYSCSTDGCQKKNVVKDKLEELVTKMASEYVLTDEMINRMADAADQYQAEKTDGTRYFQKQKAEKKKALDHCVDMVCAGHGNKALAERMDALEAELDNIEIELQRLAAVPEFVRDDYVAALKYYAGGDCKDKEYQKMIIGAFVKKVVLYDDRIEIDFHSGISPDVVKSSGCVLGGNESTLCYYTHPQVEFCGETIRLWACIG